MLARRSKDASSSQPLHAIVCPECGISTRQPPRAIELVSRTAWIAWGVIAVLLAAEIVAALATVKSGSAATGAPGNGQSESVRFDTAPSLSDLRTLASSTDPDAQLARQIVSLASTGDGWWRESGHWLSLEGHSRNAERTRSWSVGWPFTWLRWSFHWYTEDIRSPASGSLFEEMWANRTNFDHRSAALAFLPGNPRVALDDLCITLGICIIGAHLAKLVAPLMRYFQSFVRKSAAIRATGARRLSRILAWLCIACVFIANAASTSSSDFVSRPVHHPHQIWRTPDQLLISPDELQQVTDRGGTELASVYRRMVDNVADECPDDALMIFQWNYSYIDSGTQSFVSFGWPTAWGWFEAFTRTVPIPNWPERGDLARPEPVGYWFPATTDKKEWHGLVIDTSAVAQNGVCLWLVFHIVRVLQTLLVRRRIRDRERRQQCLYCGYPLPEPKPALSAS